MLRGGRLNPEEFFENLKGQVSNRIDNSINAHYGVSQKQFDLWIKLIICDMVMSDNKSEVLDKWFINNAKIDNEVKAKVAAYLIASECFKKIDI